MFHYQILLEISSKYYAQLVKTLFLNIVSMKSQTSNSLYFFANYENLRVLQLFFFKHLLKLKLCVGVMVEEAYLNQKAFTLKQLFM